MKTITIIGGGVAGLSLGIALRQRSVPVKLIEAKTYPRHKVCGEFISGRGLLVLDELGFPPWQHGTPTETITFHCGSRSSTPAKFPERGVAIPRYDFDFALARRLVELGGVLCCGTRFTGALSTPGVVSAAGRRLDKTSKWKWYGLKAHITGVELLSDLELHLAKNGYVGLCRLSDGRSNVCGLFRRGREEHCPSTAFIKHFTQISSLGERLKKACWDPQTFCAVSGLPLGPLLAPHLGEFAVGDALSMISPFTGNGMSIALESAALAVGPLSAYSNGELSWPEAIAAYHGENRSLFERRISIANILQELLLNRLSRELFARMAYAACIWRNAFLVTR